MASISRTARQRWFWIAAALLVGIAGLLGSKWLTATKAQAPASPGNTASAPAPGTTGSQAATVYTVANGDISRTLLITGELQAVQSKEIQAPQPKSTPFSTITFLAEEGKTIKKGERLIEYDSSTLMNNLAEYRRSVDEAALGIDKTKKDQEASRCDLLNSLAQAEGNLKIAQLDAGIPKEIQPANTYQQYQVNLEKAKLSLQKAKEQLANFEASYDAQVNTAVIKKSQAEITLKRAETDLDLLTVDAPQDGVVIYGDNWASNRKYQVGDQAFPGQTIIILPDLSAMQISGWVYDTELPFLAVGMACDVRLDAVPGRAWRGKIASLTSVATRKGFATTAKVFRAIIKLDSVDLNVMRPGMTAHAEVVVSMASGVLAVPRQHLSLDSQGRYRVFKETGAKTPPEPILVKVGVFGDQMVQIMSGLSAGDRLVPVQKTLENNQ